MEIKQIKYISIVFISIEQLFQLFFFFIQILILLVMTIAFFLIDDGEILKSSVFLIKTNIRLFLKGEIQKHYF
jgi:hypothetical protein